MKCRWRGKLRESARTGQVTTSGEHVAGHVADHVVPGAGLAMEFGKFLSGVQVCPRRGMGPLAPTNELPGPRAVRRRNPPSDVKRHAGMPTDEAGPAPEAPTSTRP